MTSKGKQATTKKSKNKKITSISSDNTSHQLMDVDQALISQQQYQDYIDSKNELYNSILEFLVDTEFNDEISNVICKIQEQCINDREEFEHVLHIINHISNNHHREENIITKTCQILEFYQDKIKQTFSNLQIFQIFKENKLILLFLLEKTIIKFDNYIYKYMINQNKDSKFKYCYFFYPEIEKFVGEERIKDIKNELLSIDSNIFYKFDEKRHKGENESYLCSLIIEDSVEEFISYTNYSKISLRTSIESSIFETNPFLIENKPTLIEYSAFFGSIQIFQYLLMNKVELTSSLWLYAIHSKNAELIHLLEYNDVKPPNNRFDECFDESIKCHHNDISDYIKNNLIARNKIVFQNKEQIALDIFKYHNYANFPIDFYDDDEFFYLIRYKFSKLLNLFLIKKHDYLETIINELKPKDIKKNNVLNAYLLLSKKKNIDDNSFKNNNIIRKIAIPPSITSIGNNAFSGCKKLIKLVIPSSVISIGNESFSGCLLLKEIIIPSSVKSIGNKTFYGCSSLTQITIPSSLKSIEDDSFNGCASLREIIIPSSVKSIGNKAFSGCSSLLEINIPSSVTFIGNDAFRKCSSIKEIIIPSSITSINKSTFAQCSNLISIIIPETVKSIGNDAFSCCASLCQISIPSSVTTIGNNLFSKCKSLTEITIPDSVKSIGTNAFHYCSNLVIVKIPSSVKTIGDDAFHDCSSLSEITIPNSVVSIGNKAFYGCSKLTQLKIPESVNFIGKDAFHGCNLASPK